MNKNLFGGIGIAALVFLGMGYYKQSQAGEAFLLSCLSNLASVPNAQTHCQCFLSATKRDDSVLYYVPFISKLVGLTPAQQEAAQTKAMRECGVG